VTPGTGPHDRRAPNPAGRRRPPRSEVRRRRLGCLGSLLVSLVAFLGLGFAIMTGASSLGGALTDPIESGPGDISGIPEVAAVEWKGDQPEHGVDLSFPQCGRTFRDMDNGYAIIGLDGGMPDRPNPCFAAQWRFASRQSGAAVYVNTADSNKGDPVKVGRRAAKGDLDALVAQGVPTGTPVWLDVELPEVWMGSQARHRAVLTEHLRVLAEAGHPVGVYSAPALWEEITGGASVDVPTWVGIGTASADDAASTCGRTSLGDRKPAIVQRIGTGSDGKPLDRNLTCPGTDLAGLVRPN
jgi:hypothetical protein